MTATESSIATARHAARAAAEKLAEDIIAMDVSERLALADIFLIASAPSERQVNAIVDGIEDELSKFELKPIRREGRSAGAGFCWTTATSSSTSSTRKTACSTPWNASGRTAPSWTCSSGTTRPAKAAAASESE